MTRNTAYSHAHRYANNDTSQNPAHPAPRPVAVDPNAAEVVAVNTVQAPKPTTGLGAVVELLLEGCLEITSVEDGRVLATIAGAVGGGLAGNNIEHAVRKATSYQVQVRMQDGSYRISTTRRSRRSRSVGASVSPATP
jgi:outer membrane lipoprotein SlyB